MGMNNVAMNSAIHNCFCLPEETANLVLETISLEIVLTAFEAVEVQHMYICFAFQCQLPFLISFFSESSRVAIFFFGQQTTKTGKKYTKNVPKMYPKSNTFSNPKGKSFSPPKCTQIGNFGMHTSPLALSFKSELTTSSARQLTGI
jgi:hypothetical protein